MLKHTPQSKASSVTAGGAWTARPIPMQTASPKLSQQQPQRQPEGGQRLFRHQALEARRDRWYGNPQVATPLGARILAPVAMVAVAVIVALLVWGSYARRTTVNGVILPSEGMAKIVAPQAGRIVELAVSEGQTVSRGDLLYVVDLDNMSSMGSTHRAVTGELRRQRSELEAERLRKSELDAAEKAALLQRRADVVRELGQVERQIRASEAYVASLRDAFERYKGYAERQIVVQMQVDMKEQAYMAEQQQLERLRREQLQLETRRGELGSQIETADTRSASAQSELTRQIAQIDQAIVEGEARRELRITAPRDGIVTGVVARPGETVTEGTPMATILPTDAQLQAQLGAPSSAIGFIEVGQPVMLRYEAFPYQKFGQYPGRVSTISRVALRPGEVVDLRQPDAASANGGGQNLYRITVEPEREEVNAYGKPQKLTPGMQVQATIFLDRRPLYQWIMEPIYSLHGATSGPAPRRVDSEIQLGSAQP